MSDQHSIPTAGEHASPLWCANVAPHGPHAAPNEFGSTNHCTGRPATEHGRSAEHVYEMLARAVHGERDGAVIRVPVEDIRVLLDEAARLRDEHVAALAVIERAKAIYDQGDDVAIDAEMYEALSTAPADALREHDARVAAAAVRAAALEARDAHLNTRRGTYAQGQNVIVRDMYAFLCARADRIQAEATDG